MLCRDSEEALDKYSSWGVNRDWRSKVSTLSVAQINQPEVKRHAGEGRWLKYTGSLKDLVWLDWHLT